MNKYTRGLILGAGLGLLALYSDGCKKDEPIVVHPRAGCCSAVPDNDARKHYGLPVHRNYVLDPEAAKHYGAGGKPARVPYSAPALSRQNPYNAQNAREDATQEGELRGPVHFRPNPFTGYNSGAGNSGSSSGGSCSGNSSADPCYDTSRTLQERGRACAARLPSADEVFGPESEESLEERLRECEEQNREIRQLNRDLERQIDEAMTPDHGRG